MRRWSVLSFLLIALGILSTIAALPAVGQSTGYVHRDHTRIVDGDGHTLLFRGVCLFPWQFVVWYNFDLPQGEEWQGDDVNADDVYTDLEQVVTPAEVDTFISALRDNYLTEDDIRWLKGYGFNSVRPYLDYRLFYNKSTHADLDTGFVYLDRLMSWCAANKMYCIPSFGTVPGGKLPWSNGSIFTNPPNQAIFVRIWQRIAARYATNPWIGGYDLINEPNCGKPGALLQLYRDLIHAIRTADDNHLIILEGDSWGHDLDAVGIDRPDQLPDQNLALCGHTYFQPVHPNRNGTGGYDSNTVAGYRLTAARLDLPFWLGEWGINSTAYIGRFRAQCEHPDHLEAHGITADTPYGWCFLSYKASDGAALRHELEPDSWKPIEAYLSAKQKDPAQKPTDAAAFAALMDYAHAYNIKNCPVETENVDALCRADFTSVAVPYTPLTIPGRITAAYYDMGDEGVVYHKLTFDNETNSDHGYDHYWNAGYALRNDGVCIADTAGEGLTVGWINAGEWIDYTVDCQPGAYKMTIRYAGTAASNHFHITLDGEQLADEVNLTPTGDWNRYTTTAAQDVTIHKMGKHTLRLCFDTGGYNISWLQFDRR